MRLFLALAILPFAATPTLADCYELPRSGALVVGTADDEDFIAGPETPAGICAVFPMSDQPAQFLRKGDYRLAPGFRIVDWSGAWSQGAHARIDIASGEGALHVEGEAFHGLSRSEPAIGGFEVTLPSPEEWHEELVFAVIDDEAAPEEQAEPFDCVIRLRRAGRFLVVNDNGRCGGEGVSFAGIYEKRLAR